VDHNITDLFLRSLKKANEANINRNNEKSTKMKIKSSKKLLELIKKDMKRNNQMELKKYALELILIEWRVLAKKIESIFFILNVSAVFILPTVLFMKYLFQDLSNDHSLQENCSCDSK
jgi:hypothetical protein